MGVQIRACRTVSQNDLLDHPQYGRRVVQVLFDRTELAQNLLAASRRALGHGLTRVVERQAEAMMTQQVLRLETPSR